MRHFLFPALLFCPAVLAQTATPAATTPPPTASATLAPALVQVSAALSGVRLDKWKTPGAVRQDTNANMASISRDLDGTLPPLLVTADGAPNSVAALLPVFRNVDALYDVLLRITEAADRGAPKEQDAALTNALSGLETARHGLGDLLAQAAAAQDAHIRTLETRLSSAPTPPAPQDCPETRPVHKPVHHHRAEPHDSPAQTPQ